MKPGDMVKLRNDFDIDGMWIVMWADFRDSDAVGQFVHGQVALVLAAHVKCTWGAEWGLLLTSGNQLGWVRLYELRTIS